MSAFRCLLDCCLWWVLRPKLCLFGLLVFVCVCVYVCVSVRLCVCVLVCVVHGAAEAACARVWLCALVGVLVCVWGCAVFVFCFCVCLRVPFFLFYFEVKARLLCYVVCVAHFGRRISFKTAPQKTGRRKEKQKKQQTE